MRMKWTDRFDAKLVEAYGKSKSKVKGQQDVDAARFFLAMTKKSITPNAARKRMQRITDAKWEAEKAKPTPVAVPEERKPVLVYIIGPYRADTEEGVQENIERAQCNAVAIARMQDRGEIIVPIVPHNLFLKISRLLPKKNFTDEYYLTATLEVMRRCDRVMLCEGWLDSLGSIREYLVWILEKRTHASDFDDEICAAIAGKTGPEIDRIRSLLKRLEERG